MADSLRPRAVPVPATGPGIIPASQLPGDGRPPLRAGSVHMTEHTKQQLRAAGWKDGDPVPGDLGKRLRELQDEVIHERQEAKLQDSALAAGWTPSRTSIVNITDLPPEKQAEISRYLDEYKRQVAADEAHAQHVAAVDSRIPENVQGPQREIMLNQILAGKAAADAREIQQSQHGASVVVDDRVAVQPPAGVPIPEGKTYGGAIGMASVTSKIEELNRRQREAEQPQAAPLPQTAEQSIPTTGATDTQHTNCQRCHWPSDKPFDVEITEIDKKTFLAGMLGLNRFEKQYELLGGNLKVIFRSLSSSETKLLQQQLGAMVRSGAVVGDGEYWSVLHEYRLVLSTKEIAIGGNVLYAVPDIATWEKENPPKEGEAIEVTAIPRMREYLYAKVAVQEPVRRILGQTHSKFQRLVEAIEFMSDEPNFWTGIVLPA